MTQALGFDLETSGKDIFKGGKDFIKIAGYTDDNDVKFTTDVKELIEKLRQVRWNYGHNIFNFDLLALAFHHADNPVALWDELTSKAVDTEILDRLDYPPMARDTGGSVDKYDLDHVAKRRGVEGKSGDLKEIAKKHGGFENIPVDDPEYLEYLKADVTAVRTLFNTIPSSPVTKGPGSAYARREMRVAAMNGRMTLNGFRVDIPLLEERIAEGEKRKHEALEILRDDYDLPLGRFNWSGRGKDKVEQWEDFDNPLATLEGRKWLVEVWDAFGIRNPPRTDTGRLATSAEDLRPIAEAEVNHPDLRRILHEMMIVTTIRTVYQTAQDHLVDGWVHPLISMRQASGRNSVTNPGLTVFGKRGQRWRERMIFLPDNEDHVLVSSDAAQIDMRAIAWHCKDPAYIAMFEPGKDIHTEIAIAVTGNPAMRDTLKPVGHGENYGRSANTLIAQGHDPNLVRAFYESMRTRFPLRYAWREEVRAIAEAGELLDNGFGRKLRCDPRRAYTQAPAQMGQGTAADIIKEIGLRLDPAVQAMMKVPVHDEYVFSVPKVDVEEVAHEIERAFNFMLDDVPITGDISWPRKEGKNWGEVSSK